MEGCRSSLKAFSENLVAEVDEVLGPVISHAEEFSPSFHGYCGHLLERKNLRTYVRYILDLLSLAQVDVEGKKVLDAGCGFATQDVVLALLGAEEVHGVEIRSDWVRACSYYLGGLKSKLNITVSEGDVAHLDHPSGVFDLILSNEAISHYRDLSGFLEEAHRILKVGGKVVVSDGNNAANPLRARETRRIWRRFEEGPPPVSHGYTTTPYRVQRLEIIRAKLPNEEASNLELFSRGTFGMNQQEVEEACDRYVKEGVVPDNFWNGKDCPTDPRLNMVHERLFNPKDLVKRMDELGFEAKQYGYFGGATGNKILRFANGILSKASSVTILVAPAFRIVAVKKS